MEKVINCNEYTLLNESTIKRVKNINILRLVIFIIANILIFIPLLLVVTKTMIFIIKGVAYIPIMIELIFNPIGAYDKYADFINSNDVYLYRWAEITLSILFIILITNCVSGIIINIYYMTKIKNIPKEISKNKKIFFIIDLLMVQGVSFAFYKKYLMFIKEQKTFNNSKHA